LNALLNCASRLRRGEAQQQDRENGEQAHGDS
jgi:hypothetical protein